MTVSNAMTLRQRANGVWLIAGRELQASFDSRIAYVYTVAFVLLANAIFMNDFFLAGVVDMSGYFELLPLLLAFFLPAVTMRLWAEERRHRTVEFLLTLPITPLEAILGKYAAAMALYGLFLAGSLPIVAMLLVLGRPDLGLIAGGYLGLILFGSLFVAFGMALSGVTADQIVAFVTATLLGYFLVLTGEDRVVAVLDGFWAAVPVGTVLYDFVSVRPHYDAFVRGGIGPGSLVYFGGLTAAFLWINARVLERARP